MLRHDLPERRKARRVYAKIPITCEIIDPKDKSMKKKSVLANNITSEGIYFDTDEVLTLNTEINATFKLPKSDNVINATMQIARIETLEAENKFGIGAVFVNLPDKAKEEIRQLIECADINKLLELAIEKGASDLHLLAEQQPVLRINGELEISSLPKLSAEDIPHLIYSIMTKQQIKTFEQEKELDFGIQYDIHTRFRGNVHQQRGFTEATFRLINKKISSLEDLNLPEAVKDVSGQKEGLVIISGPTGSGKTTTIAAMVEFINQERKAVIITLERPIEYVHSNIKSIIKQREVGIDTYSFSVALKSSLRQDPNVIVVGELEDTETIKTAITAAETGYLVIASFHAPNTIQAIDRLVSVFPVENRRQILSQLSHCIKGVVSQLLIPRKDKMGRALTTEVLIATEAVKRIIRNDELIQLSTVIQTGGSYKMQSMYDSITRCVEKGIIDMEIANIYSEEFSKYSR
jgi:twitching motility protein PilT